MPWSPVLMRSFSGPHLETITLGHPVLDDNLAFAGARLRAEQLAGRGLRLEGVLHGHQQGARGDHHADVFAFIKAQRAPRLGPNVVRLEEVRLASRPGPSRGV
jgi:integrase/recombinase XerD